MFTLASGLWLSFRIGLKKTHYHIIDRPHSFLTEKSKLYKKWHMNQQHAKVHYGVLVAHSLVVSGLVLSGFQSAYASSNWVQADWSGGVGPDVSTQYVSANNISVNTGNHLELSSAAGWSTAYDSWSRRAQITITNSGAELIDYQVRIPIAYDGDMKSDFSDIRFTNDSGAPLDYWIQTKTDNLDAIVWVEVDSVQAANYSNIYMYYGNTGASSESDGDSTFLFFDDFNSSSLDQDKWTQLGNGVFFTVVNDELQISGNGGWSRGLVAEQSFDHDDLSLEMKYRWASNNPSYDAFMMGWHDSSSSASYRDMPHAYYNPGSGRCSSNCSVSIYEDGRSRGTGSGSWTQNTQYLNRIQMKSGGGAIYAQSTNDGETWVKSYEGTYSTESNLRPGFSLHSGTHHVDDLRVRKSSSSEPSVVVASEEQKYANSGTLTSNVFDATFPADWGLVSFVSSGSGAVVVKARSANNIDMSSAPSWASCSGLTDGSILANNSCVSNQDQYLEYQVTLSPDGASTPVFESINFNYSASDQIPPNINASNISMLTGVGGANVASNDWSNSPSPYFSWDAGSDDGGSGVKGYCLYLGRDTGGDPVTSKGVLGSSPLDTDGSCQFAVGSNEIDTSLSNYIETALESSNDPYYLNIKVIDGANNVYTGSSEQFQFRFDNTPPANPSFISAPSNFVSTKDVTMTWPTSGVSAARDDNSGVAGLQYKIGNSGTWYGSGHTGAEDDSDILPNNGSYTTADPIDYDELVEGNNIVYFRTYDNVGNVSLAHVSTVIKLNTASPTAPQNVTASPSTNTDNSFEFSWLKPASYQGSAGNLTYCYTVNSLPTVNSCTYTAPGVTSLPAGAFATQPAENTFYVVAKDEAGNINYATVASTTFTANTSAPGVPLSLEIADISTKSSSNWKLALSWTKPVDTGAGVSNYKVFRSIDNVNYSQIAETGGTSYVDGDLDPERYYYKVAACDSANNCGASSGVVDELPTGRFTSPAELITNPSVQVSTRSAKIVWATDRPSDSRIQIGTASGRYEGTEATVSDQTKNHEVDLTNLSAGTEYFYRAKWTDEDGNVGVSSELIFRTLPAPSIKDVEVPRVTLSTATLKFTARDAVKVKILYGLSESFGGLEEINTSTRESNYAIELAGLNDGAQYFYKINTVDADGNEYDSGRVDVFTTPARPRISNIRFQPVDNEPTSTQNVTWTTNVPTTSLVRYSTSDQPAKEVFTSKLTKTHSVVIKGLLDDSTYSLIAQSRDKAGNLAVSDNQTFKTALDTRPPKLSNLRAESSIRGVGSDARGQLIISWETDEPAIGQVSYGEGASGDTYTSTTAEDGTLSTEHTVIVSDLATSQVYHFKAVSEDRSGNLGESEDRSAIVGQPSDSVIEIILGTLEKIFGL